MENKKSIPQKMAELPISQLPGMAAQYFKNPVQTQSEVLREILENAKDTEIGRKYDFAAMQTREEFVSKVPLSSWQDYAEYAERMEDGEEDILFRGKPEYFIMTSGTTGKNKLIPESSVGAAAKNAIASLRNAVEISTFMKIKGITDFTKPFSEYGHILTFSSSGSTGVTKSGIPTGFASGITSGQADSELRKMFCYPPEILNIPDQTAVDYLIMRFALMYDDIIAVAGNNAGRFKVLLEYGRENAAQIIGDIRDGTLSENVIIPDEIRKKCLALLRPFPKRAQVLQEILDSGWDNFMPKNYWKQLGFCSFWLGGSVGVYVEEIRPFLPDDTVYFDVGYGASELKINVPVQPGTPYGALGTFVGFYEFLPKDGGNPVFAEDIEDGGIYEIVVTTYSGLYRYKMGDYIQVSGKTAGTPNIMFVSKTGDTASIANEKVTGEMILRAARQAVEALNCGSFIFCQVYPCPVDKSYHCYFEIEGGVPDEQRMAQSFDASLKEIGEAYRRRRKDGSINEPVVTLMEKGWQQSLYEEKLKPGVSISQIKLPVVVSKQV